MRTNCIPGQRALLILSRVRQAFNANLQRWTPPEQPPVGAGQAGTPRLRAGRTSRAGAATPLQNRVLQVCTTTAWIAARPPRAPTPGGAGASRQAIVDGRPAPVVSPPSTGDSTQRPQSIDAQTYTACWPTAYPANPANVLNTSYII